MSNEKNKNLEEDGGLATLDKDETKLPSLYKVLLHNDDYTTMEFVVLVLKKFFNKSEEQAYAIMLKVHNDGVGICGMYTYEVAESKAHKVTRYAREQGHPLKCSFEKE